MQYVNTEILKENKNLRTELKELTAITKTWLNSFNKAKDLVFVKSSADDTKVSIPSVERPRLSESKGFILPNYDSGRILPAESQRNITNPSVAVTDLSATNYDSADESSGCSTPLPPLKKLDGAEPISGPKTIKLILRSKSTFKAETLKGVITNEPSSAPAKGNKSSLTSKVNSAPAGKLKSVKIKDDPPLAIVMKELNELKLKISKNQSSYSRNNQPQQVPQNALQNKYKTQLKKSCDLCGLNSHLSKNCYKVLFCKKCERTDHKTCDQAEYISTKNTSQHLKSLEEVKNFKQKNAEALKSSNAESSNANRSKTPTRRWVSRTNHVHHVKKESIIRPASKQNRHLLSRNVFIFFTWIYLDFTQDHLRKFDEKADDGYLLGYLLVSKAFRVFNTKRQQTEETYHITFDESPDAIKFSKPSVDNINIAENERYPPDEYLHPYEPSQRWSQDKHIELVNIIGNPGAGMLTRVMAKKLGATSAHECLFVDFISKEEPKKVSKALQHPRWGDAMQDELNKFPRNKVWTLVLAPYGKTIIGSK
ncbi:hypothetical protein Tco_1344200 [Tanacetum coccineum]